MALKHTEEFRREAVRIALSSGLSRTRVAADMGIGQSTLSPWISQYRSTDLTAPEASTDLVRENERLRLENELCTDLGDAGRSGGALCHGVGLCDAVGEDDAFDEARQLICALKPSPGF